MDVRWPVAATREELKGQAAYEGMDVFGFVSQHDYAGHMDSHGFPVHRGKSLAAVDKAAGLAKSGKQEPVTSLVTCIAMIGGVAEAQQTLRRRMPSQVTPPPFFPFDLAWQI